MKVFISHKKEDSDIASTIALNLRASSVQVYLDVMENIAANDAKKLTDHIKSRMNECTDLLVVLSRLTQESWWVPFEIGMAAQQDYPIVNYMKDGILLPDYLSYYPKIQRITDLSKYISAAKSRLSKREILEKSYGSLNETTNFTLRASQTENFYRELKGKL